MARRPGGRPAVRAAVAVVALLLVLAPRAPFVALAATATVRIGDTLDPKDLQVTPGTTVTWVNDSGNRHRVRSTSGPSEFDSGDLDPGEVFTVTFDGTGTWQYVDDRNRELSNYWGTVTSAEKPAPTPGPTPTPPPGTTPPPPTPTPAPPPGDILMAGRAFNPASVTIDPGTVVRWRNNDTREHTVTAGGAFDSGIMAIGATFTRTFTTAGTYRYLCAIHPDMTGTITVRSAGGGTPPPAPAPTPTPASTAPPGTPAPGSTTVAVVDYAFNPTPIDIVAGTTITWVNRGAAIHTVTASDGSYDSGLIAAGGRFQRRFGTPGTYPYLCSLHPSMTGVVRVSGASGASPPPAAPPTPAPTPPPSNGANELRDFAFVPASIRVSPGTTVTWVNTGAAPHTVTDRAGAFDSGLLVRGARWSRTFPSAGTFQLLCSIHPEMHATLVVAAPGATPPPPETPAPVRTPIPGSGEVAILDFDFAPRTLRVETGATVQWVNRGVAPHTVTAKDGGYDSGFLSTGDGFAHEYDAPGVYEYLCAIHPAMIGTVIVGAGTPEPPPTATASPGPGASPGQTVGPGSDQPSGSPAVGGVLPAASGEWSGGEPSALVVDGVAQPLTAEAWLRLGLVVLIGAGAIGVFAGLVRGVARGA